MKIFVVQKKIEHTEFLCLYLSSFFFIQCVHYIFILGEIKIDSNFLNLNKSYAFFFFM